MKHKKTSLENRKKILNAAIQEFGQKGYKQGSTNNICKNLKISKGIIFYYFGSKEQLFLEAVTYCMSKFNLYMQEHFFKGKTPQEGIRSCCLARKTFFTKHPEYLSILCDVLYFNNGDGKISAEKLRKAYQKHTFDILDKILEGIELNTKLTHEENIWIAVHLIELIDLEITSRYQEQLFEQTEQTLTLRKQLLEEQMNKYEGYLDALLYGILKR